MAVASRNASSDNVNPLKSDPELMGLLKRLNRVQKYKTFQQWKSKFLSRLDGLIFESGMKPAKQACADFDQTLKSTVKCADKLTGHMEKGDLSATKKTVKASLALSECTTFLTNTVEQLEDLIPSTGRDEKQRGYTKFHLGAVLVRQGFTQYVTLQQVNEAILGLKEQLQGVADRQQLDLFAYFTTKFERFCAIMADLNLWEVMRKCMEFAVAPTEEESSDEEPMTIAIQAKTKDGATKTIKLEVEPSDTLQSIKEAVAVDVGIDAADQCLSKNGNEVPNDDNTTLAQAGIKDGDTVTIQRSTIPIIVQTMDDGKQIPVGVDPSEDYVSDIKLKVAPASGVAAPDQVLRLKDDEILDDNKLAIDYGLLPGTVVFMEPKKMDLVVKLPDGSSLPVQVAPSGTPDDIKKAVQEATGMSPSLQNLHHDGAPMASDKSLKDAGVMPGDTVKVRCAQFPINIKSKDGVERSVLVSPTDTVGDIKERLKAETSVPIDQQILSPDENGKKPLLDSENIAKLQLKPNDTLWLAAKPLKLTLQFPNGTTHTVEITALDSAESISANLKRAGMSSVVTTDRQRTLSVDANQVFQEKS